MRVADRTIRGRVPVSALVTTPLAGHADVELTVDNRGRPGRLRWQMDVASAGTVRVSGDVAHRGWRPGGGDIAAEGVKCLTAELEYFQPDRYFARYTLGIRAIKAPRLSIEMSPRSCRGEPMPDGAPFVAGPVRGTVAQAAAAPGEEPFRFFTAEVGTFRVRVETNLAEADVLAAIGSMAPLDLATQPVHQGRDMGDDDPLAILDFLVRHALPSA